MSAVVLFAESIKVAVLAAVAAAAVFLLILLLIMAKFGKLWFQAYMSNARVSMMSIIGMSLRQVNARVILESKIMAMQSGIGDPEFGITTKRLEAHYLAGGNVPAVIWAVIAAHRAGLALNFDQACAIDLAGRDVRDAVQTSVNPKVIDCPDPKRSNGRTMLSAIARNGVELKVRARVTVRTNISQLIGGATEETIIARVGEGIITAIGSAESHLDVMENPDLISKAVLKRGLDSHTAYEIVSIDIADIEVGENIGARLRADGAEAATRVARASAERKRAEAVATEQEMKARVVENRALVLLAEAEVPLAMAAAFRAGNLERAKS